MSIARRGGLFVSCCVILMYWARTGMLMGVVRVWRSSVFRVLIDQVPNHNRVSSTVLGFQVGMVNKVSDEVCQIHSRLYILCSMFFLDKYN